MKIKLELFESDLNKFFTSHFEKEGKVVKSIKINLKKETNYQETSEWTVFKNIEVELEEK